MSLTLKAMRIQKNPRKTQENPKFIFINEIFNIF